MPPPFKPAADKLPALTGRLMVDTVNGKVRVRAWPKKRGPHLPEQTRLQVERFVEAQQLIKQLKGSVMNWFIDATKGSGLYPRDLAMKMMTNGPISFEKSDGYIMQFGRPILEKTMFQGFALRLTADQNILSTTLTNLTWPAPTLDTAGFFNAGSPTFITIPDGVTVIELTAGFRRSTISAVFGTVQLRRLLPSPLIMAENAQTETAGLNVSSGPIVVVPGETYAASVQINTASTLLAVRTFFSGEILQGE